MTAPTMLHVFERAGLGVAPFRFIGIERRVGPIRTELGGVTVEVGAPGQPMGSCQYCGQGIAECCVIRDANGKTFIVGNECVRKTGDAGLKKAQDAALRDQRAEARLRKANAVRAEITAKLDNPDVAAVLAALPHPQDWAAKQGKTRLNWAEWMLKNAGNAGREDVARFLKKIGVAS